MFAGAPSMYMVFFSDAEHGRMQRKSFGVCYSIDCVTTATVQTRSFVSLSSFVARRSPPVARRPSPARSSLSPFAALGVRRSFVSLSPLSSLSSLVVRRSRRSSLACVALVALVVRRSRRSSLVCVALVVVRRSSVSLSSLNARLCRTSTSILLTGRSLDHQT